MMQNKQDISFGNSFCDLAFAIGDGGIGTQIKVVQALYRNEDVTEFLEKHIFVGKGSNFIIRLNKGENLKEGDFEYGLPPDRVAALRSRSDALTDSWNMLERGALRKLIYPDRDGLDSSALTYEDIVQFNNLYPLRVSLDPLDRRIEKKMSNPINVLLSFVSSEAHYDEIMNKWSNILNDDTFTERIKEFHLEKLAVMTEMAEIYKSHNGISDNYKPLDVDGNWQKNWLEVFNYDMPNLRELIDSAKSTLARHSNN